jgi:putative sigma-54 modulation protein
VPAAEAEPVEEEHEPISIEDITIVRSKSHALKPMTPEEAVLQMEQVHHDFYVFINGTSETVAVVYRRKDGGYGLIEPETE